MHIFTASVELNNPNQYKQDQPKDKYQPLQESPSEQYTPPPPALTGQQSSNNVSQCTIRWV